MTQAAPSEKIGDDVGGADYHMIYTGTCDAVGDNDEETIKKARELLSYLPNNYREKPPLKEPTDDPNRVVKQLSQIVPAEFEQT